ncbi:MAG: S41 family peptidase [Bacteroidia bacterium]|jgi:hypothetical protein|nr:S41 family peptidase [Bacteroidia bacterium]
MRTALALFSLFLGLLIITSCEKELINDVYDNTPTGNFKAFTDDFRDLYGAFNAKKLNWDSLSMFYAGRINDHTSSDSLYRVFCAMLNTLNDGHADLWAPQYGHFRSWNRRNKPFFVGREGMNMNDIVVLQNLLKSKYLKDEFQSGQFSGWQFFYGTIQYEQKAWGYICIPTFNIADYPVSFIQEAVNHFNTLDGVIIDLRFNQGGRTDAFVSTHNRFGSVETLYLKSRFRNGPRPDDFTPLADHRVRPHTNSLKNKPIAILTNAYTASSSDHFVLAMKTQPNVITVGDTTCGAFSAVIERILPNGWKYRLGAQEVYAPDGNLLTDSRGQYLEGIGIVPDFAVNDNWAMINNKNDLVLEKALSEISKIH